MQENNFPVDEQNKLIRQVCQELADFLCAKNTAYGGAALSPLRVASKADPLETINVRIDDKLSRLVRGEAAGEDPFADLQGYLVLREVAKRRTLAQAGLEHPVPAGGPPVFLSGSGPIPAPSGGCSMIPQVPLGGGVSVPATFPDMPPEMPGSELVLPADFVPPPPPVPARTPAWDPQNPDLEAGASLPSLDPSMTASDVPPTSELEKDAPDMKGPDPWGGLTRPVIKDDEL